MKVEYIQLFRQTCLFPCSFTNTTFSRTKSRINQGVGVAWLYHPKIEFCKLQKGMFQFLGAYSSIVRFFIAQYVYLLLYFAQYYPDHKIKTLCHGYHLLTGGVSMATGLHAIPIQCHCMLLGTQMV